MSNNEFLEFMKAHPDTQYLDVFYCDLSCVIRGKRYPIEQAEKVFKSGMMTPGSTFLLSVNGESTDPQGMGVSDGDPDEVGNMIPGTLVPSPWAQLPTAQVMMTLKGLNGTPYYYEPRNVLQRVLDKFKELNLRPMVAFELEFYLFDPKRGPQGELIAPLSPLTGNKIDTTQVYSMEDVEDFSLFLHEVTQTCALQGVTTGAISGEYAPGQFEINLQHSDNPLMAADHSVMFRRVVQSVAKKHGMQGTFMAKPYPENSGSGLHIHISLLDQSANNAFDGGGEYGERACGTNILFHAIAGLQKAMPESMGLLAPNTNSFQRFVPDTFVPMAPSWGYENRSVAMRIPKSLGNARRIEHRIAGADANPYLTLATILAAMHHGIVNTLQPSTPWTGNAGKIVDPNLPLDVESAMQTCRNGSILNEYFGQDYLNVYCQCKEREFSEFSASGDDITKWYL